MDTLRQAVPAGDPAASSAPQAGQGLPLSITVPLPARTKSVPVARALVSRALEAWQVTSDDAALVVSELTANAVSAARRTDVPLILVRVSCTAGGLLIEAGDRCPDAPPAPGPLTASADAESGRGLLIVHELAARYGWYYSDGWKVVWAYLPAPRPSSARTGVRGGNLRRAA